MKFEIVLAFGVLVVLTGSSQTTGQSVSLPPAFTLPASLSPAGTSQPPDLTRGPANESEPVQTSADTDGPSVEATTIRGTVGAVGLFPVTTAVPKTETMTQSPAVTTSQTLNAPVVSTTGATLPSAAPESLSSTPAAYATAAPPPHLSTTDGGPSPTGDPLTTFSSRTPLAGSTHLQPQSSATTTGNPLTSAAGRGAPGPPHREAPSELNVGDEELKGPHSRATSPLDPLLAALLSFFIVTTAIVFVVLFLKFRQRTNHPEFHRLQDLPMDDLMEDTPLSRYSY